MSGSGVNGAGTFNNPIRVGMQLTTVHEEHRYSYRNPDALMTVRGVWPVGFAIRSDFELSGDPEAHEAVRRLFEQCCDAVKDVIRHGYYIPMVGRVSDPDEAHPFADGSSGDSVHDCPPRTGGGSSSPAKDVHSSLGGLGVGGVEARPASASTAGPDLLRDGEEDA